MFVAYSTHTQSLPQQKRIALKIKLIQL